MKGWRTIIFNAVVVALTALLQYLADIDFVSLLGPQWSVIAMGVINMALRFITSTPVGKAS